MDGIVRLVDENYSNLDKEEICLPSPPEDLGYEAKCIWLKAGKKLLDDGFLDDGNFDLFHSYCVILGEARECESILAVDGKIVGGKKHPAYDMMLNAVDKAKNLWVILHPKKLNLKEIEEEESVWDKDKGLLA